MYNVLLIDSRPITYPSALLISPYGLEIIKSSLENIPKVSTTIYNPFFENDDKFEILRKLLLKLKPISIGIGIRNIDNLLIVSNQYSSSDEIQIEYYLPKIKNLINLIKNTLPKTKIVLGGVGFSGCPESCLEYLEGDFGIIGPGEYSFRVLVERIINENTENKESLLDIPGIILKKNNKIIKSTCISNIENEKYFETKREHIYFEFSKQIAIRTSYGCSLNCIHCIESNLSKKVQLRPIENIIIELKYISNAYPNISKIMFSDSEINLQGEDRIIDLCKSIIDNGFEKRFSFRAYFSVAPFSEKMIKYIKKANIFVSLSLDHLDNKILKNIGKNYTRDDFINLYSKLLKAKIKFNITLLFGMIGETEKSISDCLDVMSKLPKINKIRIWFSVGVRIYPNSLLNKKITKDDKKYLYQKEKKQDPLNPLVYSSPFSPFKLIDYVLSIKPKKMYINVMGYNPLVQKEQDFKDISLIYEESMKGNYYYYYNEITKAIECYKNSILLPKTYFFTPWSIKIVLRLFRYYISQKSIMDILKLIYFIFKQCFLVILNIKKYKKLLEIL